MKVNLYKKKLLKWSKDLFPLNRSLAGKYNRKTISYIKQNINKNFKLKKFKSGKKVFSWKVPDEYNLIKGILKDDKGNIICDIKNNNLHTVAFSTSVNKWLTYKELKEHIFFSDKRKNAIPYVTTYYKKKLGLLYL